MMMCDMVSLYFSYIRCALFIVTEMSKFRKGEVEDGWRRILGEDSGGYFKTPGAAREISGSSHRHYTRN
jgi:hypothetical protein